MGIMQAGVMLSVSGCARLDFLSKVKDEGGRLC